MRKGGIVAFAFGSPGTILPNKRIAQIATDQSKRLELPIYTQQDVLIEEDVSVERVAEKPGKPPSTLCIARGAIQWAIQNGISQLWVVAAKPHLYRAIRDLRCAAEESRVNMDLLACRDVHRYSENSWFSSESTQPRTQLRRKWERREGVLRMLPLFIYKIIAR